MKPQSATPSTDQFICVWRKLPDPRCDDGRECEIQVREGAWRHLSAHIADKDEPWDKWLGRKLVLDLIEALRATHAPASQRFDVLKQASEAMDVQVRRCFKAPLVLVALIHSGPSTKGHETWLGVLANGALIAVAVNGRRVHLKSCYFKTDRKSRKKPLARTWQDLRDALVKRYAPSLLGQSLLPNPNDPRPYQTRKSDGKEWASRVRFVTPGNWGFDASRPGASWSSARMSEYLAESR